MRLSAIAEEAIGRGFECFLAGNIRDIKWLDDHVKNIGFSQVLKPEYISRVMDNQSVLVIDSYHLPVDEPSLNPRNWKLVVSISDALTPSYGSNLVIYPGMNAHRFSQQSSNILFGPKFIPLRKSISKSVRIEPTINPRLLIFGGGTDQFGFAVQVARLIRQKYLFREASFIYHESIEIESMDPRFKVFPFGSALDSIIRHSDLVITSASTSSFEVLARGIPTGIVRLIGNQDENFCDLGESGLVSKIGNRSDDGSWIFFTPVLEKLILDVDYRNVLSRKNLMVFDFLGSSRILDEVTSRYEKIS